MRILFYSTQRYEQPYLERMNDNEYDVVFTNQRLDFDTVYLSRGFDVISIFANDNASAAILNILYSNKVRHIAIRESGYDNVDLEEAKRLKIAVANVPANSPHAVAEHTIALLLALNRKLILSDRQMHSRNFLSDDLVGFDLHGKKVGIIGAGKIGAKLIEILHGFGCTLLVNDINENTSLQKRYGFTYAGLAAICEHSDIISIHTPLVPQTRHIINKNLIETMREGTVLINTSRGACVKTADVIVALESGKLAAYGADVYENEQGVFFQDLSGKDLNDPMLDKLLSFPNVLLTPHQAFATKEALNSIAATTFQNITRWKMDEPSENELFRLEYF